MAYLAFKFVGTHPLFFMYIVYVHITYFLNTTTTKYCYLYYVYKKCIKMNLLK